MKGEKCGAEEEENLPGIIEQSRLVLVYFEKGLEVRRTGVASDKGKVLRAVCE